MRSGLITRPARRIRCSLCNGTGFIPVRGRYLPCVSCQCDGFFYMEHPRHRDVLDRIIEAVYANEER